MATVLVSHQVHRQHAILTKIALIALVVAALIGGDPYRVREHLVQRLAPSAATQPPSLVGWNNVVTLRGIGDSSASPFSIDRHAVQWRVKWSCQSGGQFTVQASGQRLPMIDALCPGAGVGFAGQTGTETLDVKANGSWQLEVEQQAGSGRTASSM